MAASASEGKLDLPEGWIVAVSKRYPDRTYYFNTVTGATSWKMPELTQSSEMSKKSKKKHRRHKKRHLSQSDSHGQKTQQQQTREPDIDDDDSLDLTYEGDIEPGRVFCACCAGISEIHHHLCDSKDSDKKPVTTEHKRKRKQSWDSTSGLNTKLSSPAEDCDLSSEQLQLIPFPKSKRANRIEGRNGTCEVIDKRNLAEVTNTTSSHCGAVQDCAGTNVDNLDQSISSKIMSENKVSEKVGGKKQKMSASSKTAKEFRQDVESSQTKTAGVKQRNSVSQPGEPSCASVPSVTPVLTSVKSGKAGGVPSSGSSSGSVKGGSSVISDKSKGVAGQNQGADRTGEKTEGHKNAAKKSKRRKGQKSSQTPERSGAESHKATSLTRPPVIRGEEASTASSKPELPRTGDGQQKERTILKAKRRISESPPTDKRSERKTPPASTSIRKSSSDKGKGMSVDTPVSSKGPGSSKHRSTSPSIPSGSRNTALSDASASRSTDCFQPKQKLSKDPSLSAFTAARGQSHGVNQPSHSTQEEPPHQTSDSSQTNPQRTSERSHVTSTVSVASLLPHVPEQSKSGLSSPPVNLGRSSPSVSSGPPTQTVTSALPVASPLLQIPKQSGLSPPPVRVGTSTPGVFSHTPAQTVSSGILTPTVAQSSEEARNAFPITPDSGGIAGTCWGHGRERAGEAAMEVDDDYYCDDQDSEDDQVMVDLQELRERFQPEMKAKAVGVLTESVQKMQTSETISPVVQQASGPQMVYIVVDTNVLIGALSFLQTLREMSLKGFGHPFLVFPWVVLQELDGLKNCQNKSKKAQNAVRYIHSCLTSHHPRVRGQTPAQALEPVSNLPIECSDDRVLQCCLQCQKKYGEHAVMLLTDDLNLENKAVVLGIKCFSSKGLQPLFDKPLYEIEHPAARNDPPAVGVPAGDRHGHGAPQQRQVDTGRSTPVSTTSGGRQAPQGREVSSPSVDNQLHQQRATMDGLLEEAKATVKTVLTGVVQKEMKEAFGDLWLEMVIRKPPWSPQDLLVILQKHWIAVFSLKMDREMKTIVDELVKEFRPTHGVNRELKSMQLSLQRCLRLVTLVNQVSPCRESVQQLSDAVNRGRAVVQDSNRTGPLSAASPPGLLPTASATDSGSARSSAPAVPISSSSFSASPVPSATVTSQSIPLNHSRKPPEVAEDQNMNQAWSVSGTESLSLQKSSSAPDLRSSSPMLSGGKAQIPKTISAEENAAIGGVFQGIWGAIYNCCDNVEKMMGPQSGNNDLHSVKATLCRLLPHAVQLHDIYQKCLSLSPCVVDQHVDTFCRLCCSLNSFFVDANIPATPLPPVTPATMIVFVQQTENRIPLLNGLEQLNNLIERLRALIACIPNIS